MVGIRDRKGEEGSRGSLVDAAISPRRLRAFFEENWVRYHHIIDPRTGHSASKVRSATSSDVRHAHDGLSKTAFVWAGEKP